MNRKRFLGLLSAMAALLLLAVPAWAADDLEQLVAQLPQSNPDLAALETQVTALNERVGAVNVWPDPVFSAEYSSVPYDTWALDETPMSGVQFVLRQTVPFPGQNSSRESVAEAMTEVKKWELAEKRVQLEALLRQAYWRLALSRQLQKLTEEQLALLEQIGSAAQAAYQVGRTGQADLLRLDLMRDKMRDSLGDYRQQELSLLSSINAALNRPIDAEVLTPKTMPLTLPDRDLDQLVAAAENNRPMIKMYRAMAKQKAEAADNTRYEYLPQLSFWLGYRYREEVMTDPGTDFMSAGISFPLPLDYTGHWRAARRAFNTEERAARQQAEAMLNEIRGMLQMRLAQWQRAAEKTKTYEESLTPQAQRTVDSLLAAYRTGRTDFNSLYMAQLQAIDYERETLLTRFAAVDSRIAVRALTGESGE